MEFSRSEKGAGEDARKATPCKVTVPETDDEGHSQAITYSAKGWGPVAGHPKVWRNRRTPPKRHIFTPGAQI